jgi:hypothetical protein
MSSHVSNAFASEVSAFFRSAGRSCTVPLEISFFLTRVRPELRDAGQQHCVGIFLYLTKTTHILDCRRSHEHPGLVAAEPHPLHP